MCSNNLVPQGVHQVIISGLHECEQSQFQCWSKSSRPGGRRSSKMNRTLACKVKTVQNESSCPSSPKPLPCLGNSADHWAWDNSGCWAGHMHSQRVSGSPRPGLLMNIGKSRDKRLQLFWTLVDKELSLRPEKSIEQMTCKSLFLPHDIWYV